MMYWLTAIGELAVAIYLAVTMASACSSLDAIATELKTIRLKVCRDEAPWRHIRGL